MLSRHQGPSPMHNAWKLYICAASPACLWQCQAAEHYHQEVKALAVGRNTTGISVRNEERREIDGRLENDGEWEERVQAEKLHRELFYQVLKDLTLMILTDAHEYARVYVSKDSYSNKYNEQDR